MATELIIYGAGGFAREVAWLAENGQDHAGQPLRPVCFVSDVASQHGEIMNELPVLDFDTAMGRHPNGSVVIAIGSPADRARIAERLRAMGCRFATVFHRNVERSRFNTYGSGVVVCAGSILTTNIELRDHVHVNLDCTIGHDAVLEECATLAPGVHVSGRVRIGRGAYVGTGANIINGTTNRELVIGDGAVIGAGACVVRDVPAGTTVVGVPAAPIRKAGQTG